MMRLREKNKDKEARGLRFSHVSGGQVAAWLAFSCFYLLILNSFWKSFPVAAGMVALMVPAYILQTECLRFLYRKLGIDSKIEFRCIVAVLGFCLIAAGVQLVYSFLALDIMGRVPDSKAGHPELISRSLFHFLIFCGWSLAHLWQKTAREKRSEADRRREALAAAERAELQMLRFQLNPHFLFNSLNGIITEIQDRPPVALEMTHRLAEYLRHSLECRDEMIVPLSHEINGVREYLDIEQDRFGDRLEVSFDLPEDVSEVQVPSFLLQPLIENAVKYGMDSECFPWQLRLEVQSREGGLVIRVYNPGEIASFEPKSVGDGVGLDVLKRRLALHYPERSSFDLRQEGDSVCAEILLKGEPC